MASSSRSPLLFGTPSAFPAREKERVSEHSAAHGGRARKTPGNRKTKNIAIVVTPAYEELLERLLEEQHGPSIAAILREGLVQLGKDRLGDEAVDAIWRDLEGKEGAPLA